jgi:hypothetical protein
MSPYKIGDRVAFASLNYCSGCIVCSFGAVVSVADGMIEIKGDNVRPGNTCWIYQTAPSVIKLP